MKKFVLAVMLCFSFYAVGNADSSAVGNADVDNYDNSTVDNAGNLNGGINEESHLLRNTLLSLGGGVLLVVSVFAPRIYKNYKTSRFRAAHTAAELSAVRAGTADLTKTMGRLASKESSIFNLRAKR